MSLRDTSSTTPSTAYALQEMATREEYQPIKEKPRIPIVGEDDQDSEGGCCNGFCAYVLIIVSVILVIMFFPFSLFFLIKIVPEYERAVIFRLGRLMDREAKGPGTFFILPCIDKYVTVDLRTKSFDVPPQNVLTKDSVTIFVDAVVYYKIFDPIIASTNIRDAGWATRLLSQTLLRNVLGAHSLSETMTNRDLLATTLQTSLDEATDPWGVKVERVEIKDVRLPQQLQRAMAAEAEASREARAKVIAAEGEMNAARALKEAAEVISRSPTALQLRYLQTLSFIAGERGSTIMFPIPLDMLGGMAQNWTPPVGVPFVGQPPPSMPLDPNNP